MALLGYLAIGCRTYMKNPWHFWPALIFCYAVFPVVGLLILIRFGYLKDLHVFDQKKRNLSYPLALTGTLLAWYYLFNTQDRTTAEGYLFVRWAYAVNFTILGIWILNRVWVKVSAHMAGAGGLTALMVFLVHNSLWPKTWLWPVLLISVLIYVSRRGLSAHSHIELAAGTALGFITTFAVLML